MMFAYVKKSGQVCLLCECVVCFVSFFRPSWRFVSCRGVFYSPVPCEGRAMRIKTRTRRGAARSSEKDELQQAGLGKRDRVLSSRNTTEDRQSDRCLCSSDENHFISSFLNLFAQDVMICLILRVLIVTCRF